MPTISKKTKIKKVVAKKKTTPVKAKAVPVKKKVVKKTVAKKTKKLAPKKVTKPSNKITVDIISDDESEIPTYSGYQSFNQTEESNTVSLAFSSWPDFNKTDQAEDILHEVDDVDADLELKPQDLDEYDKQKKFFADWATQNAPKDGETAPSLAPKKSIRLYRRQAVFYLGATVVLLIAVAYLFFVKLNIQITPQGETINDSVSFSVVGNDATSSLAEVNNKVIGGSLTVEEVSSEDTFKTSEGSNTTTDTNSLVTGTVTLINNYNKNQVLVATTRLLSTDGKLFRLKSAVNIPAGGRLTASVYADKPGAEMAITTPTKFTIPGLWAGIQDLIYAESTSPLTYQTKKIIKQSDLDSAKKVINEALDLKIKNDLQSVTGDKVVVYGDAGDGVSLSIDAKLGETKDEFTVKATKKVVLVTFSKERVAELAKARLSLVVSDDKQLATFNPNQITYTLEDYDTATKKADIKAYFTGLMSLKSNSTLIDSKKLVGLNETQISQYLNTFPEIKDYNLEFWPPFIKTAPNLPDRINIQIGD